jgi:hypothetical protein
VGETFRFLVMNVFIESAHPSIRKPATFGANHQPDKGKSDWGFWPRLGRASAAIAADGKFVSCLQPTIAVEFE